MIDGETQWNALLNRVSPSNPIPPPPHMKTNLPVLCVFTERAHVSFHELEKLWWKEEWRIRECFEETKTGIDKGNSVGS